MVCVSCLDKYTELGPKLVVTIKYLRTGLSWKACVYMYLWMMDFKELKEY